GGGGAERHAQGRGGRGEAVSHPDVLIVGGGVIGLTTAYYLAGEGVRVRVVERGEVGREASWAGAGIVQPGGPERASSGFERVRAHSSRLYPQLSRELRELTGLDNGYLVCGGVEVPDPDEPHTLPTEEWHSEGTGYSHVGRGELESLWPGLHPALTAGVHL